MGLVASVLRVLIRGYQLFLSLFFTGSCRYLPGCSDYAMTTVWIRNDHHWSGGAEDDPHIHHVIDDLSDWIVEVADRIAPSP